MAKRVISETIGEIKCQPPASWLDSMRALSASRGETSRAVDYLRADRCGATSLCVTGSEIAARLAAQLIGTGFWFECEQLDRERWHFAVAPAAHGRLIELHRMLLHSRSAR